MSSPITIKYAKKNNHTINQNSNDKLIENKKRRSILLVFICAVILLYTIVSQYSLYLEKKKLQFYRVSKPNLLDGCRYIYIDMGTNIGVQIRKLYEPHLYKNAPVLHLFKELFANSSTEVCSIGFEANPLHDNYLKEFESYCLKRGWRVKIFTSTAVSITNGQVTFYTEPGNEVNNQWGASLEAGRKKTKIVVPSIDIISWIRDTVLDRKLPSGNLTSKIMMKSDIEGHDSTVLANLILSGVYCSIDLIYGEHLTNEFVNGVALFQKYSQSCKTKLIRMDDESFYQTRLPFTYPQSTT